jgi:hypothetical protein
LEDYPHSTHLVEHDICKICVTRYLWIKIMNEGTTEIPCPAESCPANLAYDDIKGHGGAEAFARYPFKIPTYLKLRGITFQEDI